MHCRTRLLYFYTHIHRVMSTASTLPCTPTAIPTCHRPCPTTHRYLAQAALTRAPALPAPGGRAAGRGGATADAAAAAVAAVAARVAAAGPVASATAAGSAAERGDSERHAGLCKHVHGVCVVCASMCVFGGKAKRPFCVLAEERKLAGPRPAHPSQPQQHIQ